MNTRGLTELIVLNLALEKGVISQALFAMLVIMALITTFMAGPLLRLLDPKNELGTPVEEELVRGPADVDGRVPGPVDPAGVDPPRAAERRARSPSWWRWPSRSRTREPPRELILARLIQPPRGAAARGGLQTENRLLAEAANEVNRCAATSRSAASPPARDPSSPRARARTCAAGQAARR